MRIKYPLVASIFVLLFLLGGASGCGGGSQSGEQGNGTTAKDQGSETGQKQDRPSASKEQGGETGQQQRDAPKAKIALGRILSVNSEKGVFALKPSQGDRMVFKVLPKARIKLGGNEAELADMKKGQQAQIKYVVRERGVKNQARSITLFEDGNGGGG